VGTVGVTGGVTVGVTVGAARRKANPGTDAQASTPHAAIAPAKPSVTSPISRSDRETPGDE